MKSGAARHVLSPAEKFKAGIYLQEKELTAADTLETLASEISAFLGGRTVTIHIVYGLLEMIDKKLVRAGSPTDQSQAIKLLAECIRSMAHQLGITLPSQMENL